MASSAFRFMRWEWFKLQRRWMPWILLGLLLLFSQLSVWGSFFSYYSIQGSGGSVTLSAVSDAQGRGEQFQRVACNDLLTDPAAAVPEGTSPEVIAGLQGQCRQQVQRLEDQLWRQYQEFTLPGSFSNAFGIAQSIGLVLVAVLTASAIGSDFGLGTLRPILIRGMERLSYLAGKFLLLVAAAAGALLAVGTFTVISSLIAAGVAEPPTGAPPGSLGWANAGASLVRNWASFIPYIAFAGTLTILTRSTAAGMAIGLGYYFAEGIVAACLPHFSRTLGWLPTICSCATSTLWLAIASALDQAVTQR